MIDEHAALRAERAAVLETIRSLDPIEWDAESLCDGGDEFALPVRLHHGTEVA